MEEKIEIREISTSSKELIEHAARLVWQYSWGPDYPVHPIEEMRESEYHIGAFAGEELIGYSGINRLGSPDGVGLGEMWYAYVLVLPAYRKQGIRKRLYDSCLAYALSQPGRILACTDNPSMEKFFHAEGWEKVRVTRDAANDVCTVYEYSR
jgi:GNAT superfamily N-acetyltransferase